MPLEARRSRRKTQRGERMLFDAKPNRSSNFGFLSCVFLCALRASAAVFLTPCRRRSRRGQAIWSCVADHVRVGLGACVGLPSACVSSIGGVDVGLFEVAAFDLSRRRRRRSASTAGALNSVPPIGTELRFRRLTLNSAELARAVCVAELAAEPSRPTWILPLVGHPSASLIGWRARCRGPSRLADRSLRRASPPGERRRNLPLRVRRGWPFASWTA